jgi:hypothetical protein
MLLHFIHRAIVHVGVTESSQVVNHSIFIIAENTEGVRVSISQNRQDRVTNPTIFSLFYFVFPYLYVSVT